MKLKGVKARGCHKNADLLDELQRIEQQMRGAVAARMNELVQELAVRAVHEPLEGERGAQEVPAEMLELLSGVRGDGGVGMQTWVAIGALFLLARSIWHGLIHPEVGADAEGP